MLLEYDYYADNIMATYFSLEFQGLEEVVLLTTMSWKLSIMVYLKIDSFQPCIVEI